VKGAVLLVGEDYFLSNRRANILRDWETAVADPADAPQAIHGRSYDLVIFCHAVPDLVAKEVIAVATKLYPDIKFLAIDEGDSVQTHSPLRHSIQAVCDIPWQA